LHVDKKERHQGHEGRPGVPGFWGEAEAGERDSERTLTELEGRDVEVLMLERVDEGDPTG
jgi:hypothetical protein